MSHRKNNHQESARITMMNSVVSEDYLEEEVSKINGEDIDTVLTHEVEISEKIKNAKPLKKFTKIGKVLFEMLRDVMTGHYPHTPWFTIATMALMLLYVLNPLDIIPDFIPVVGYIDDFAVLTIGLGWIETDIHKYLDWRIEKAKENDE